MATRRDQLQSYQFMTQRVLSAFVMRETDPAQSPLRRGIGAVFAGIMVAVLVGAGFGVYGILTKVGGTAWKADGSIVVERETGATFVFMDGRLHPTLNFTSALLASGRGASQLFRVSQKSLGSVPRGITIGITGAPDSLPPAGKAVGLPWTVCSTAGTSSSGGQTATVSLMAGEATAGARVSGNGQGVLIKDVTTGLTYLVVNGHRHQLWESRTVIPALFGAVVTPAPVGTAWINALPAGVPISPITINNRGTDSKSVTGRKIGDLLVVQTGSGPQHYLVFDDGIAPITQLQKNIFDAQFPGKDPVQVSVGDINKTKSSSRLTTPEGNDAAAPSEPPKLDLQPGSPGDLVCATTTDPRNAPQITVGGTIPSIDAGVPTIGRSTAGTALADRVSVPAGRVAIVRVLPSATATSGAYAIITDMGVRFSVPSAEVLRMLGYSPDKATDVPSSLVTRIPAGPVLDPAAVFQPQVAGAPAAQSSPAPSTSPSGSPSPKPSAS
ncbi:type VII secretion protein EccB [Dactylosporangium fulvum]|uniref:Type VII secretion protein EccB n=1 Tax=Dactylosporangium fulvum TaxID=53359 RepID=A0ABY5VTD2_9ACTN|nr:type VII secretion protein EccB [Dactylosporangium fulvum]UWP80457.1 type VII secretion protein EccB [Dactylosporangium fulvum]